MYRTNTPAVALPTTPGAIIGYRRNGQPIRLIGGGAPDDGGDGSGDGGDTGTGSADDGGDTGTDGGTPPADPPKGEDQAAKVARLEKDLTAARAEAAKSRTNAKAQAAKAAEDALVQKLGKALGLIKDGEAADPAKLTQQIAEEQSKARQAAVELAVYKTAGKHSGDPSALLDSRSFVDSLKDVDPGDEKAIGEAVANAVKNNPKLAAGQVPGRSGGDHSGGPGGGTKNRPTSLGAALKGHYGT